MKLYAVLAAVLVPAVLIPLELVVGRVRSSWAWPLHLGIVGVLAAWLIAAPLGLLLRALLLGAATLIVPFVLVTLSLGGALLLVVHEEKA